MSRIISIVYQPNGRNYNDPHGEFMRISTETAELVTSHGIRGDQKAGRSKSRQLNVLTTDWLEQMSQAGYKTAPGEFGEQVILDGIQFSDLSPGLQIALGDQAIIEITKPRTGCDRLEAAQGKPFPKNLKTAIGFMATVIAGGTIQVGDDVRILSSRPA